MQPSNPPHSFLPCLLLLFTSVPVHVLLPPPSLLYKHIPSSQTPLFIHSLSLTIQLSIMKNSVVERFSEFYENWVRKLEEILQLLLEASNKHQQKTEEAAITEQELQALVSKVTTHLKEYYTVKWGLAREDVLVFFSPVWLSPLENAYLWVTGWKPSTAFKLLESLKNNKDNNFQMTEEQERKIEELRLRMRMEEEKVEMELERQQVAMADRKIVGLSKLSSRGIVVNDTNNGDVGGVDGVVEMALKGVFAGLERVMKASDCVRLKTLKGVLDVLAPMQCVQFLAANIAVQLRLRQWGMKKDILDP